MDGTTFVGLIALRLVGTAPAAGPAVPYLGAFCEMNVRLSSVDAQGRCGVVFLSMDAERLVPVLTARLGLRLPYLWSAMRLTRYSGTLHYSCRRRRPGPRAVRNRMVVEVGAPVVRPTAVDRSLTARWGLHVRAYGRTWYLPNAHEPWPLHGAAVRELHDGLVAAAGVPTAGPPHSVPTPRRSGPVRCPARAVRPAAAPANPILRG